MSGKSTEEKARWLYELVNAPMLECKMALVQSEGDLQAAVVYLTTPRKVFRTCTPGGMVCYEMRNKNE